MTNYKLQITNEKLEMRDEEKHFGMWERDERQIKRWERKKGNKGVFTRECRGYVSPLQITKRYFFVIFITYFFGITKFFRIFAGD